MASSSIFSAEARRFCQTTSVRGIPRIINSKSVVHSVIWLLGVLTCTMVLIWQVVVLFTRFQSYPVNTAIDQSPEWDNTTFPDITICNLCSLVYETEMTMSYLDYILTLNKTYYSNNFRNIYRSFNAEVNNTLEAEYYQSIFNVLVGPNGYFLNFPVNSNSTRTNKSFPILGCSYFNWDYSKKLDYNCIGSVRELWDPDHYKCYTLKLNNSLRKSTRGFSAIIYVEDVLDNAWTLYDLDLRNTRAKGMKVLIHEAGTKPNMKLGFGIETGMSTTITLKQTKISRLPEPYSNCTPQLTLEPDIESPLYTHTFCKDVCLQEQFLEQCGCILSIYQYTDSQLQRANNSICGNVGMTTVNSSLNWQGVQQILCVDNVYYNKSACNECPLPCTEYHYEPRVTANSWPHVTSQLAFYVTYIAGNLRFGNKFSQYMTDYKYNFDNRTAALSALKTMNEKGVIRDNFLQVNIQFNSNAYQRESQVAAFSTDAFGAQLGGVLSLWLGVTIILIFEVCEFIINLLSAVWSDQRNQPPITVK